MSQSPAATMWRSGLFWRLLRAMAVVFLTMIITVSLSLWFSNESITQTVAEHDALINANILSYLSANIDSAYRSLDLLTSNEYNPRFYDIQRDTLDNARRNVQLSLDRSKLLPAESIQLDELLKSYDSLMPQLFALNGIARTDLVQTRTTWELSYQGQMDVLRSTAHNLAERISLSSEQRVQVVARRQAVNQWSIVALAVGGLLLGLLLTLLVLRPIVGRISGINADLARLADGDLTPPGRLALRATRPTTINDEIIGLEQSYLRTIRRLAAPLHQIQQDANRISSASAEITEAANAQANNATEGVTAITEVTVTVEELNQTAVQIADAAASVAAAAEQALLSAGHGQEAVRDSIIGMAMIRSRVN
ncbi:MAG: methyl-accepting chemotaxis protein, partial [Chloroflexota bacterium]|nr:methyl-accepting chemotaxis protein [Chloroflexota bacterium]